MPLTNLVESWVDETAGLTKPSRVVWCDGSKYEYDRLIEQMLADGTILPLNSPTYPNCYLHRSDPSDVARTEQLTYICARSRDDAGRPITGWRRRTPDGASADCSTARCAGAPCT